MPEIGGERSRPCKRVPSSKLPLACTAQRNNGSDAGPSTGRSATVGGSRSAMARAQPTVSVPDLHTLPGRETTTTLINMFVSGVRSGSARLGADFSSAV